LLVPGIDYGPLYGLGAMTKGIAVRHDLYPNAILDPLFGPLGLKLWILVQEWLFVVYTVSADFMSALNHALEKLNVLRAPAGLTPIGMPVSVDEDWIGVGDQEKRGGQAVSIENGKGLLKLAPQSVVEGQGY
jgi:hypothetical protein